MTRSARQMIELAEELSVDNCSVCKARPNRTAKVLALLREDNICLAGEEWSFHSPHSSLHRTNSLARSNKILFVTSTGIRMLNYEADTFFLGRVRDKLKPLMRSPFALSLLRGCESWVRSFIVWVLGIYLGIQMCRSSYCEQIVWVTVPCGTMSRHRSGSRWDDFQSATVSTTFLSFLALTYREFHSDRAGENRKSSAVRTYP